MHDPQTLEVFSCPYCGEANEIEIDLSVPNLQDYVEDCQVCCRPCRIRILPAALEPSPSIEVIRSDE